MMQLPSYAKPKSMGRTIALGVLLLALAGFWYWYESGMITANKAHIDGLIQPLTAGLDGRIAKILVQENQSVTRDQVIMLMDDGALMTVLAESRAHLEALRTGFSPNFADPAGGAASGEAAQSAEKTLLEAIQNLRQEETVFRRDVEHLVTLHTQALLEVRRIDTLPQGSVTSTQRNEARLSEIEARAAMDSAKDQLSTANRARAAADIKLARFKADLLRQQQQSRYLPENLRVHQMQVQGARVREAEQNLAAATLRAGLDGEVGALDVVPGMVVHKGQVLGVIIPSTPQHLWVTAFLDPAEVANVKSGQTCRITFNDYPGFSLNGVVQNVNPHRDTASDTGEQSPVNNTTNATPVQQVPVRIGLEGYDPASMPILKVGMDVTATIHIR